ncbi:MAG: hypothetical protein PF487_02260 [Bacteroidales bacterium]|jgi:hypothetical protein|nr:hypothetical protein [Bacteroidales bacterium]
MANKKLKINWGEDTLEFSDLDYDGDIDITLKTRHNADLDTVITKKNIYRLKEHIDYLVDRLDNSE